MLRSSLLLLVLALPQPSTSSPAPTPDEAPSYTADGQLKTPAKYREWVFLTSGIDMSYNPQATAASHSMFDNVFVNPSAYKVFQETGKWPDKTMLVLETRGAEGNISINKRGHTQSADIMGFEVHVKDASLEGGWGFYAFDNAVSAKLIKRPAGCYSCHEEHAAVDTTFVQFYPTLLGLAKTKGTLSAAYLKETAAPTSSSK
jgi:Cytochrome P460